jgi:hypothetical protein
MCAAQSGNTSPGFHPGKRAVLGLFVLVCTLYLIGYGVIYIWSEDIEIIPKIRGFLGIAGPGSETTIIDHSEQKKPKVVKKKPKKRYPRQELLPEDLPIIDEFTESIEKGRPVPAESPDDVLVRMPDIPEPEAVALTKPLRAEACWDTRGFEHTADKCDSLFALNQLLKSKLTAFETCREAADATSLTGPLRFFIEADFVRESLSFWLNQGIGVQSKTSILKCVSEALASLSLDNIPHRHSRYRLAAEVRFKGSKTSGRIPDRPQATKQEKEALEKAITEAKEVDVVRERVRVRKSPVDGEIIGFISKPAKVKLIETSDDWCLVKTKRGNIGWMVCWGLSVGPPPSADAKASPAEESSAEETRASE